MPLVQITLARGRTTEQLQALGEAVTSAVNEAVGAPRENVRVVITSAARALVRRGRVAGRAAGVRQALMLVPLGEPGGAARVVAVDDGAASRSSRRRRVPRDRRRVPRNGGPLAEGRSRATVVCPSALYRFDLDSGACATTPGSGSASIPSCRWTGPGSRKSARSRRTLSWSERLRAHAGTVRGSERKTEAGVVPAVRARNDAPTKPPAPARAAASQAFLALDDEQRAAADAVQTADELGGSRRWARKRRRSPGQATARPGLPSPPPHSSPSTAPAPSRAPGRPTSGVAEIEAARETIRRFRAAHARTLDEAAHMLRALPVAVQEARTALVAARNGRADRPTPRAPGRGGRRNGSPRPSAAATALDAAGQGIRERRTAATRTLELARSAATLAAEAPGARRCVRRSPASPPAGPRGHQGGPGPPALSALRREFFRAVLDRPRRRREEGAGGARRRRPGDRQAHELADAGEWDDAADAIAEARARS